MSIDVERLARAMDAVLPRMAYEMYGRYYTGDDGFDVLAYYERAASAIAAEYGTGDRETALREALDSLEQTARLLEYLWSATGNRAPDMPVSDLFNDDDPIIEDMLTTVGKARMVLHGQGRALTTEEAQHGD